MHCPQCGRQLRENQNLCWNCGAYVPQAPAYPVPQAPVHSLAQQQYPPPQYYPQQPAQRSWRQHPRAVDNLKDILNACMDSLLSVQGAAFHEPAPQAPAKPAEPKKEREETHPQQPTQAQVDVAFTKSRTLRESREDKAIWVFLYNHKFFTTLLMVIAMGILCIGLPWLLYAVVNDEYTPIVGFLALASSAVSIFTVPGGTAAWYGKFFKNDSLYVSYDRKGANQEFAKRTVEWQQNCAAIDARNADAVQAYKQAMAVYRQESDAHQSALAMHQKQQAGYNSRLAEWQAANNAKSQYILGMIGRMVTAIERGNPMEMETVLREAEADAQFTQLLQTYPYAGRIAMLNDCTNCGGKGSYIETGSSVSFDRKPVVCPNCKGIGKTVQSGVKAQPDNVKTYYDEPCEVAGRIQQTAQQLARVITEDYTFSQKDGGSSFNKRAYDYGTDTDQYEYELAFILTKSVEFKGLKTTKNEESRDQDTPPYWYVLESDTSTSNIAFRSIDDLLIEFDFEISLYDERPNGCNSLKTFHCISPYGYDKATIRRYFKKGYGLLTALEGALKRLGQQN